jgi:hypothetical protein
MPVTERVEFTSKFGAVLTVEGHALSLGNTMLCLMQHSGVSVVGGFRQWIKQGRAVMKGQHGMMIWVPVNKPDKQGESTPVAPDNGEAHEAMERRFIIGTVFDISQTQEIETSRPVETVGEMVTA